MKHYKAGFLFLALICAFTFGCGKDEDSSENKTSAISAEETTASETASSETVSAAESSAAEDVSVPLMLESSGGERSVVKFSIEKDKPFNTLDEFVESESGKKVINEFISNLEKNDTESVFSSKVYAEENNFVLERRFSSDFNLWLEKNTIENLKTSVESKKDVYISVVDVLEGCIDQRNLKFCVRYTDPDGKVLFEKQFDNSKLNPKPLDPPSSQTEVSGQTSAESAVSSAG